MDLYYLRTNGERVVVGTADDFDELAKQPRPETGYEDLVPPRRAPDWQTARTALLADYRAG